MTDEVVAVPRAFRDNDGFRHVETRGGYYVGGFVEWCVDGAGASGASDAVNQCVHCRETRSRHRNPARTPADRRVPERHPVLSAGVRLSIDAKVPTYLALAITVSAPRRAARGCRSLASPPAPFAAGLTPGRSAAFGGFLALESMRLSRSGSSASANAREVRVRAVRQQAAEPGLGICPPGGA